MAGKAHKTPSASLCKGILTTFNLQEKLVILNLDFKFASVTCNYKTIEAQLEPCWFNM